MPVWTFRAMTDADLPDFVRWRNEPHVTTWFPRPPADVDAARDRYGARLRGDHPTVMRVAMLDGRPVGYVQDFPVDANDEYAVRIQLPGAAGFDYLIGEPDLVGRGLGTAMLRAYVPAVLLDAHPDAPWIVACPDARNAASLRVLDKLGFEQRQWITPPGEEFAVIVCRLARADANALGNVVTSE
ncbi:aminoglycoside 6'-N-acetyltransferase [Mumia flava]|uniref:Aminoglycoside 6'-N-acetyltransferase n=1 Tax=Mumia flava TaxID=1348852 RepID=A0A2M9BE18_9ACTN|nr:GNAT family N-acetyltransferase [Mumia flava]PJJ56198.1 aminoglycoside 6'-N-acetyltransferase [Mumia flava]